MNDAEPELEAKRSTAIDNSRRDLHLHHTHCFDYIHLRKPLTASLATIESTHCLRKNLFLAITGLEPHNGVLIRNLIALPASSHQTSSSTSSPTLFCHQHAVLELQFFAFLEVVVAFVIQLSASIRQTLYRVHLAASIA